MRFSYTLGMENYFFFKYLDLPAFSKAGGELSGQVPLSQFKRLLVDMHEEGRDKTLRWAVKGELKSLNLDQDQIWLHLNIVTVMTLTCQRCLQSLPLDINFERSFRFVATEEEAENQDDEVDEDVLVWSHAFDLAGLVEDEIILELPAIAKHNDCLVDLKLNTEDADFSDAVPNKPHPFAVLEKLKGK